LDRHCGLLNGAKEHLEGYPPLIHRWCSHHFAANIWKKQRSKQVIAMLKALCKVKKEKKFEARLKELEKILNDDAKAWLFENLPEKSKWALTFDDGGSGYGIMTTNILDVFIFILKGIRSLPVFGIVDYTFTSVTSTSIIGGRKYGGLWQKGSVGGDLAEKTFSSRVRYQLMKLSSHQAGLMLVVRYQEDAYSEWR
jgi:hypothetical protein